VTRPDIDLQRAVARARAVRRGVPLVTPDSPAMLREAAALFVSAVTDRTYDEVRRGVSFYAPRIVGKALSLLPSSVRDVLDVAGFDVPATGLVLLSDAAWNERPAATLAHEIGHYQQDAAVSAQGIVGSVLWGVGYLAHPLVRGWDEGRCRVNDLVGLVVLDGVPIDEALADARKGADLYRLDDAGRALYLAALDSAADSLRAGVLPGVATEIAHTLKALVDSGWDAGPWAEDIVLSTVGQDDGDES